MPPWKRYKRTSTGWLQHYNYERPHRGYRNMGRKPVETIEAGKAIKEQVTKEAA